MHGWLGDGRGVRAEMLQVLIDPEQMWVMAARDDPDQFRPVTAAIPTRPIHPISANCPTYAERHPFRPISPDCPNYAVRHPIRPNRPVRLGGLERGANLGYRADVLGTSPGWRGRLVQAGEGRDTDRQYHLVR